MSIDRLLNELNSSQLKAAKSKEPHTLVLAGAGCGKTKTIIAHAAYLISDGIKPNRIQILTFTKRAASEIVESVRICLGEKSEGLRASTFHSWCSSLIRRAPNAFGLKDFTVIDRDDQLDLFKIVRGKRPKGTFLTAAQICDLYSYARNTRLSLSNAISKVCPDNIQQRSDIAYEMKEYELRKRQRNYLDYDDVLEIVAKGLVQHENIVDWISSQYDHLLVDEMQDTNPLQWDLLYPLTNKVSLFCVGDDAQSIYAFRGADFQNVHSFKMRLPQSTVLKLEDNYRSTQEILDLSNWLLKQSTLNYDKTLRSVRGSGIKPAIHTFDSEWEEARWIAEDLVGRRSQGKNWKEHMILSRSGYAFRAVEVALAEKQIPYCIIGGTNLFEASHVRDLLSVLRIIANSHDEIGWMRYLTLWPGIGEVRAGNITDIVTQHGDIRSCITAIEMELAQKPEFLSVLEKLIEIQSSVSKLITHSIKLLHNVLESKYRNQNWSNRVRDFIYVEQLAQKHSSILAFLEEYILNPISHTSRDQRSDDDIVTLITIHSAKGTERNVCYVLNVSPTSFPPARAIGKIDEVEEERRVLYVAFTRAKNELIITRNSRTTWASDNSKGRDADPVLNSDTSKQSVPGTYFLNSLPISFATDTIHSTKPVDNQRIKTIKNNKVDYGIDLS